MLSRFPHWRALLSFVTGSALIVYALYLCLVHITHAGTALIGSIGVAMAASGWFSVPLARWLQQQRWRQIGWQLLLTGFVLWAISVAAFFRHISLLSEQAIPLAATDRGAIIVLGSGVHNCIPSPALTARLNRGAEVAMQFPAMNMVVSGGYTHGRSCSEAEVMAAYLIGNGIPANRLIQENTSTTTYENLRFTRPLLQQRGFTDDTPLIIVSSEFHLERATAIARRAGFRNVYTAASATPMYTRFPSWLREYFSFIKGYLFSEY
ncbi:YdcF family protein [Undibacterium squillarum]|uniref:DUF218 domain-containing protein n=1 Tax=Undibacterium squillarum TaxID=1131567 RepID=A0ABQ2Y359_9BURK|nr:YdcF family protein [Undibacterium squillarum]GGX53289.1 hypothetical protein GCM10010946_34850 [Undibacterium squillarum]